MRAHVVFSLLGGLGQAAYEQLATTCTNAAAASGKLSVSSVTACEQLCDAKASCVAVDTDGKDCYLKSHCEGTVGSCSDWCGYRKVDGPDPSPTPSPPAPTPPVHGRTIQRSNVDSILDTSGGIINAHETQIVQWEADGPYHMYAMKYALCHAGPTRGYGCSSNKSDCDFRHDHNVSVYTSPDLTSGSWHWEADILPGDVPSASYFRAKVLRHRASDSYVLYTFGGGRLVIAKAQSATGPFVTHSITKSGAALLHKTGDLSFFIDDDEAAYIIYNADMGGMQIERLSEDYLSPVGRVYANASSALFGPAHTEAPVLFKRQGLYYALFDHTCCVCSYGSGVQVWTSESPLGNYTLRGQVGRDEAGDPLTHAQQCWIMHLPGADPEFMWVGDQWGSAPDGLHGHDRTYWQPLRFNEDGSIQQFSWMDSVNITIPDSRAIAV